MTDSAIDPIVDPVTECSPEPMESNPAPETPKDYDAMFDDSIEEDASQLPMHTPSLVLGILSICFALLIPLVSYVCSIIGLSLTSGMKDAYRIKPGKICCIVGFIIALISHFLAFLLSYAG